MNLSLTHPFLFSEDIFSFLDDILSFLDDELLLPPEDPPEELFPEFPLEPFPVPLFVEPFVPPFKESSLSSSPEPPVPPVLLPLLLSASLDLITKSGFNSSSSFCPSGLVSTLILTEPVNSSLVTTLILSLDS